MYLPGGAFIALTVGVCMLILFVFLVVVVQHNNNTAPPVQRRHRLKLHAFPAHLKAPSNTRCVAAESVVAVPMVTDANGISLWRLFLGDDLQPIFACLDTASPCLLVATNKCKTCTGSETHGTYSPPDAVCREPETQVFGTQEDDCCKHKDCVTFYGTCVSNVEDVTAATHARTEEMKTSVVGENAVDGAADGAVIDAHRVEENDAVAVRSPEDVTFFGVEKRRKSPYAMLMPMSSYNVCGLCNGRNSFLSQIHTTDQGSIKPFTICFTEADRGMFLFGDLPAPKDPATVHSVARIPRTFKGQGGEFYMLDLHSIRIGGTDVSDLDSHKYGRLLVDTGSNMSFFPPSVVSTLRRSTDAQVELRFGEQGHLSLSFPPDVWAPRPMEPYVELTHSSDNYCILGALWMQHMCVTFGPAEIKFTRLARGGETTP